MKGKELIIELGLLPPNICDIKYLSQQFERQITGKDLVGTNAVSQGRGCLGLSGSFKKGGIILVGKGMVFDSGGANIKLSSLEDMKYDMLGAATILGVKSKTKNKNVGYIGCIADNYFGEGMLYPSYVIEYPNKVRVEIVNTDAEGRLVLADGILEAKKYNPKLIITVATLTGSAKAALGPATAVFTNDPKVANKIMAVGKDLKWAMPIFDIHRENIKADDRVADIKNCGTIAGASTAAAFLEYFVDDTPWVHFDIAGSAYNKQGPTGCMLDTMVKYLNSEIK